MLSIYYVIWKWLTQKKLLSTFTRNLVVIFFFRIHILKISKNSLFDIFFFTLERDCCIWENYIFVKKKFSILFYFFYRWPWLYNTAMEWFKWWWKECNRSRWKQLVIGKDFKLQKNPFPVPPDVFFSSKRYYHP